MRYKVIKVGGALLEDEGRLELLCRKLAKIEPPFMIVHGGGIFAGQLAERLGIPDARQSSGRVFPNGLPIVRQIFLPHAQS